MESLASKRIYSQLNCTIYYYEGNDKWVKTIDRNGRRPISSHRNTLLVHTFSFPLFFSFLFFFSPYSHGIVARAVSCGHGGDAADFPVVIFFSSFSFRVFFSLPFPCRSFVRSSFVSLTFTKVPFAAAYRSVGRSQVSRLTWKEGSGPVP